MRQPTTPRPEAQEREFVLGPERVRATILTTAAETDGCVTTSSSAAAVTERRRTTARNADSWVTVTATARKKI